MAGLLDLFSSDEGLLGLALMAEAAPKAGPRNTAGGLLNALQFVKSARTEREDRELKRGLLQSQIAENESQAQQRAAQAKRQQQMLESIAAWQNPAGPQRQANAAVAQQTGNLSPTLANAALQQQAMGQAQQYNPLFGIPREAIDADLSFNNGKGIAEFIFKRGTPNMDFVNGVAVDKNQVRPGFSVPTTSANGQSTQLVSDPSAPGGFRVIAPQGASDTYSAYRDADEAAKARYDVMKVYNPQTQREEYVPRSVVAGASGLPPLPPQLPRNGQQQQLPPLGPGARSDMRVPPEVQRQRDTERVAILKAELAKTTDPMDKAALLRELARAGAASSQGTYGGGGTFAAGPSSREAAGSVYDVEAAKDMAGRRKTIFDAGDLAGSRIQSYQQLSQLLAGHDGGTLSPAGLQIAKTANSLGFKIDPSLPNKEAAVALSNAMALDLRNPAGGAGMPGAMSDADRQFLANMIPNLATSAEGRGIMIRSAIAIEQRKQQVAAAARRYEARHGRIDNGFYDQLSAWSSQHPLFAGER